LRFTQLDDLLSIPGVTAETLQKMREFVVVLPGNTRINVNTASAEVLSAKFLKLSMSDAALVVANRDRTVFWSLADFKAVLPDKLNEVKDADASVSTNYFIVSGRIKLGRSSLNFNALIDRVEAQTKIIWIREY